MDSDRIYGRLFLPDSPNQELEAWLSISPKQILIETSIDASGHEQWPILLGKFNGIDKITFVNCYAGGGVTIGAGGRFRRIRASYCIKGIHVYNPSELMFNSVTLLSPALSNWIIESQFIDQIAKNIYKVPDYVPVLDIKLDNIRVTINSSHSIKHSTSDLHISKVCTVTLQCESPIGINEYASFWRDLKKLILFLTNKNPEFEEIYLSNGKDEFELLNVKDEIKDDRFSQGIDISYHQVRDSLISIVTNWFEHKKLRAVIDLVLEKSLNTQMSAQGFFLNVCVALETFHDNFLSIDKTGIEDRAEKRNQIASLIKSNEGLYKWFNSESSYWKNPTLAERLAGYKSTIEYIMGTTFRDKFDVEVFISNIVKTRNDMAHSGEYLKRFTSIELFLVGKLIEYTIRLEVLSLIGVNIKQKQRPLIDDARRHIQNLAYLNNYNQERKKLEEDPPRTSS